MKFDGLDALVAVDREQEVFEEDRPAGARGGDGQVFRRQDGQYWRSARHANGRTASETSEHRDGVAASQGSSWRGTGN